MTFHRARRVYTYSNIAIAYLDHIFEWQGPDINRLEPSDRSPGLVCDAEIGNTLEL